MAARSCSTGPLTAHALPVASRRRRDRGSRRGPLTPTLRSVSARRILRDATLPHRGGTPLGDHGGIRGGTGSAASTSPTTTRPPRPMLRAAWTRSAETIPFARQEAERGRRSRRAQPRRHARFAAAASGRRRLLSIRLDRWPTARTADDVPPVFVAATMQILRTRLIRRLARRRTSLSHHLGQLPHVSVPAGRVAGNCKGARMLRVAHRSAQKSR
jgi:hypothetical protein